MISSPSVSISPSPSSIDAGQSTSVIANPISGSGSYTSYSWFSESPGSSTFSSVAGVTISIYLFSTTTSTDPGTHYFEATVTDINGAFSLLSNEASVTVFAGPTVSVSSSGSASYRISQTVS